MLFLALASALASPSRAGLFSRSPQRLAIPAPALPPGLIVRAITPLVDGFAVNGARAVVRDAGQIKTTVNHPSDPSLVVDLFHGRLAPALTAQEMELDQLAQLPKTTAPRVPERGVIHVPGRSTPYTVREAVTGLDTYYPTEEKFEALRATLGLLAKAGLEIVDTDSEVMLRAMFDVGETRSDGFGAYLKEPAGVTFSKRSERELHRINAALLERIALPEASRSPVPLVRSIVRDSGDLLINGKRATPLASGPSKVVVRFPDAPDFDVTIFGGRLEKKREMEKLDLLSLKIRPPVINHGQAAGEWHLVQEHVHAGEPATLLEVYDLFRWLWSSGVEIVGGDSVLALGSKIEAGPTRSHSRRAYLVDPDVKRSEKTPSELWAFYEELLGLLFP